jgi:hypothetical protein
MSARAAWVPRIALSGDRRMTVMGCFGARTLAPEAGINIMAV